MQKTPSPFVVALAGVPNVGKTTVFNKLTGSNQKTGNYPGITVDKVIGSFTQEGTETTLIDLPGTYNLFPHSDDEQVVFRVLCGLEKDIEVDAVLAVADMSNLNRSLFLVTQLIDMGYPTALLLNMEDQSIKEGTSINKTLISRLLGIPVYTSAGELGKGIPELKKAIANNGFIKGRRAMDFEELAEQNLLIKVSGITNQQHPYRALQVLKFRGDKRAFSTAIAKRLEELAQEYGFNSNAAQQRETEKRYKHVNSLLEKTVKQSVGKSYESTRKIDKVILHPKWGFAIFIFILLLVFQAIFTWAQVPMNFIDESFAAFSAWVSSTFAAGPLTDLISQGIIPGIGGIVIFVPQIALLFAFLAALEASGYMARAVFITDRVMRPFGLNGRSVVPLISGFACAIPAIMAARNISNSKDRLITIFVTPFISCSARLPVYIILIGLIFPDTGSGFFDFRGLALFFMYLIGIAAALASAWILKVTLTKQPPGQLALELPKYRWPRIGRVLHTMYDKSKSFVLEAGQIILIISIILWGLASYGPSGKIENVSVAAQPEIEQLDSEPPLTPTEIKQRKLESSYAGILGQWIEPVIKPLGYDWKIGIALICSFAAREVFVSTMATLYSVGAGNEDLQTLQQKLQNEKREDGSPVFSPATIWSLLVFYAFAMQCMSTIAVVYRETNSIKWPLIQTVFMTAVAYFSALAVYQILS